MPGRPAQGFQCLTRNSLYRVLCHAMTMVFWQRRSATVGAYVFLGLVVLTMFVIRLKGPPDLMDNDQERPAAYVIVLLQNGNWLCQRDATGDITSKPPLY